jgi:hypothetical protein
MSFTFSHDLYLAFFQAPGKNERRNDGLGAIASGRLPVSAWGQKAKNRMDGDPVIIVGNFLVL